MKNENVLAKLREIGDGNHEITASDKKYLKQLAHEYDVQFDNCKTCPNIWHDLAVQLYARIQKTSESYAGAKYVLKDGVDVYFGDIRINAATLTDELAKKVLARGFARRWFAVIPESDAD